MRERLAQPVDQPGGERVGRSDRNLLAENRADRGLGGIEGARDTHAGVGDNQRCQYRIASQQI
jgi:hypothetical protein